MKKMICVLLLLSVLLCTACTPREAEEQTGRPSKSTDLVPEKPRDPGAFTDKIPLDGIEGKPGAQVEKDIRDLISPTESTEIGDFPTPEPVKPETEPK